MPANNLKLAYSAGPQSVELGFRAKAWNFSVNSVAYATLIFLMFFELFVVSPVGLVVGLVTNRYPTWAYRPFSGPLIRGLPLGGKSDKWSSRPFYRPRRS